MHDYTSTLKLVKVWKPCAFYVQISRFGL